MDKPLVICFLPNPLQEGRGAYILRSNLHNVLKYISTVSGDFDLLFLDITYYDQSMNLFFKAYNLMIEQLNNIAAMLKHRSNKTVAIFPMDVVHIFPILLAKFLGIRCIYFISGLAGSDKIKDVIKLRCQNSKYLCFSLSRAIFSGIYSKLESINYMISDTLIVESPQLARQLNEDFQKSKVILNGSLFVDKNAFAPIIQLNKRECKIGYFGALEKHKGISNFIESIPIILKKKDDANFVIIGTGSEYVEIKERLKNINVSDKVVFYGNIAHKEIPDYLNETKILVLPSYGEGLPNIVLEAMACGTPVLATQVGGIPDVIKDGDTGFLMEDNSPECIASNLIRALESPDLEDIAQRARALMEREYTFEKAVERWKAVLEEVSDESLYKATDI